MRKPPNRLTTRRWCLPTALLLDTRENLEGTSILDEFPRALAVYLWQRARDVALWASLAADDRSGAFTPQAADRAVLLLLDAMPEDLPASAVEGFDRMLRAPGQVSEADVAGSAEEVAAWAHRRGAGATGLAYTQAAALACPADPARALITGRLADALAQPARAETWFRRAAALGRSDGDWISYAAAYTELGGLRERAGDLEGAHTCYVRARRTAIRYGLKDARGAALHGMMRLAMRREDYSEAEQHGRHARKYLGPNHLRLRNDLAELAVLQGEGASAVPVLKSLLSERTDLTERIHTLRLLCRAAAQAGDRATLEEVWPAVEELTRAASAGVDAGGVLLELARATAGMGAVHRAEVVARVAAEHARTAEERDEATKLLQGLFR